MAPGTTFPLVDKALGGNLAKWLTDWRADGKSYETIARLLHSEHGIDVSTATVYRWCEALTSDGSAA